MDFNKGGSIFFTAFGHFGTYTANHFSAKHENKCVLFFVLLKVLAW